MYKDKYTNLVKLSMIPLCIAFTYFEFVNFLK